MWLCIFFLLPSAMIFRPHNASRISITSPFWKCVCDLGCAGLDFLNCFQLSSTCLFNLFETCSTPNRIWPNKKSPRARRSCFDYSLQGLNTWNFNKKQSITNKPFDETADLLHCLPTPDDEQMLASALSNENYNELYGNIISCANAITRMCCSANMCFYVFV